MGEGEVITISLKAADVAALRQLRDEVFAGSSIPAVALKCMRDELVRCGLRSSSEKNRSRGAKRSARRPA